MAEKEEFEIIIGPDGKISIDIKGASGKSCIELTEFLEKALGEVEDRQLKPEYYTQEVKKEQKRQQRS
jgi:hypothetical protein